MTWILIALAAYLAWAVVNVGDKYIIGHRLPNYIVYFQWLSYVGLLSLLLIPFIDFSWPRSSDVVLLVIAGFLFAYSAIPYAKALETENITRINVWWSMVPVFTLILARLIMGEVLTSQQLLAFMILFVAILVASFRIPSSDNKVHISRGLSYMILSSLGYAFYAIIIRFLSPNIPFLVQFIWINTLQAIAWTLLLVIPRVRSDFVSYSKIASSRLLTGVTFLGIGDAAGLFFNVWAYALAPAALVAALGGTQGIFVFVVAIVIHRFNPTILNEGLDRTNVILKLLAVVFVAIGIVVLSV